MIKLNSIHVHVTVMCLLPEVICALFTAAVSVGAFNIHRVAVVDQTKLNSIHVHVTVNTVVCCLLFEILYKVDFIIPAPAAL